MDLDDMIRVREELRFSKLHEKIPRQEKAWWWQIVVATEQTDKAVEPDEGDHTNTDLSETTEDGGLPRTLLSFALDPEL